MKLPDYYVEKERNYIYERYKNYPHFWLIHFMVWLFGKIGEQIKKSSARRKKAETFAEKPRKKS